MYPARSEEGWSSDVHYTRITLSERFNSVPSHNPLRPNAGTGVAECSLSVGVECPEANFVLRDPRRQINGLPKSNKIAVITAQKDAIILRLKGQLRDARSQINFLKRKLGGRGISRSFRNGPISGRVERVTRRGGGGFVIGRQGKHVNISNRNVLGLLRNNENNGVSPMISNRKGKVGRSNISFFGEPRSKDDLDNELDAYMSQSKSKVKSDLDKELDSYMAETKAKSFAGQVGLLPPSSTATVVVDQEDSIMETI